jgi:hypothetical protein
VVQSGDVGHALSVTITETNSAGQSSQTSSAVSVPAPPVHYAPLEFPSTNFFKGSAPSLHLTRSTLNDLHQFVSTLKSLSDHQLVIIDHVTYSGSTAGARAVKSLATRRMNALKKELTNLAKADKFSLKVTVKIDERSSKGLKKSQQKLWRSVQLVK